MSFASILCRLVPSGGVGFLLTYARCAGLVEDGGVCEKGCAGLLFDVEVVAKPGSEVPWDLANHVER